MNEDIGVCEVKMKKEMEEDEDYYYYYDENVKEIMIMF